MNVEKKPTINYSLLNVSSHELAMFCSSEQVLETKSKALQWRSARTFNKIQELNIARKYLRQLACILETGSKYLQRQAMTCNRMHYVLATGRKDIQPDAKICNSEGGLEITSRCIQWRAEYKIRLRFCKFLLGVADPCLPLRYPYRYKFLLLEST